MSSIINALTSGGGIALTGDTSGQLQLQTNNGTTAVTIDTSQNVGVGTASPATKLHVAGGDIRVDSGQAITFGDANNFILGNSPANTLRTYTNGSERMRIDSSGNVGIGTASPTTKLALNVGGATDLYTRYTNGTFTSGFYVGLQGGANALLAVNDNLPIAFQTNGTERMRIDSSGNLLVGTTTSDGNGTGLELLPAANNGGFIGFKKNSSSASGDRYTYFARNGAVIGSITQNGTTGVLYNLTSDYRLKNNPQPLTGASEFVMALQPKTWDWWDGSGKGVGFIAHEFMEVAKYSGNGVKDEVDADEKPVYQTIQPSSSEVMANLVSLIQEQQALITQLQADVAALKGVK